MKTLIKHDIEYTDTFGGEANYSWCRRETVELPENASRLSIVRACKKALGLTGTRCRAHDFGDMIELRPVGSCTVAFIHSQY